MSKDCTFDACGFCKRFAVGHTNHDCPVRLYGNKKAKQVDGRGSNSRKRVRSETFKSGSQNSAEGKPKNGSGPTGKDLAAAKKVVAAHARRVLESADGDSEDDSEDENEDTEDGGYAYMVSSHCEPR
jgi:hypothetical protein